MIDTKLLDDLSRRLAERLPPGVADMKSELETQFRQVLSRQLQRLDLVGRDEFETQQRVLERTRAQLEELERQIEALSQRAG